MSEPADEPVDEAAGEPADEAAGEPADEATSEPAIELRGLTKTTKAGDVFRDVSARVAPGEVLVLSGPKGSGKTMLLLAVLGRMRVTSGGGSVLGHDLLRHPNHVRDHSSVAHLAALTALEGSLTVRQHVAERMIMQRPWYLPVAGRRAVDQALERFADALGHVADPGLDELGLAELGLAERPAVRVDPDDYVDALDDVQRFVLEVALACMGGDPVIGVDDVDLLRRREDRLWAWLFLLRLGQERRAFGVPETTVVACCQEDRELRQLRGALGDHADDLAPVRCLPLSPEED